MASSSIDQPLLPEPCPAPGAGGQPSQTSSPAPTPDADAGTKGRAPRHGIKLVIVAFATWLLCAGYTLYGNPEIRFFKEVAILKRTWAARMTTSGRPKTVFFGGSSCTFAVDPERLLQRHGIPAANFGLGAGMGLRVLTRFALEGVAVGDTLIMAMEPTILMEPMDDTMLGVQTSYALGHPEWLARGKSVVSSSGVPWVKSSLMLRPGGRHTFTLLGKLLSGKPLYRYHLIDFNAAGWQQTAVRNDPQAWVGGSLPIPAEVREYLIRLRQWCDAHQVRLAYALPWTYTDDEHAVELRRNNLSFLKQIATILPVLHDARLGVDTVKEDFADTVWHLRPSAAQTRTDELAEQLKSWRIWSAQELVAAAAPAREAIRK